MVVIKVIAEERGEPLYAIHAEFDADYAFASEAADNANGFTLTS